MTTDIKRPVHLDGAVIGDAADWAEAEALLKGRGVHLPHDAPRFQSRAGFWCSTPGQLPKIPVLRGERRATP